MTNKEAKVFLDNLKICIDEHPVVADWLVEIADRKTEPSNSEIPNNCEVKNYCDDCLYTDTCDSKEFFYACTSKATISKMEQVDEPITQTKTQNSNLTFEKADERCKGCNHYKLTCDLFSEICRYEPKDEPQTEECPFDDAIPCEWVCPNSPNCKYKQKTEPQTEREGE